MSTHPSFLSRLPAVSGPGAPAPFKPSPSDKGMAATNAASFLGKRMSFKRIHAADTDRSIDNLRSLTAALKASDQRKAKETEMKTAREAVRNVQKEARRFEDKSEQDVPEDWEKALEKKEPYEDKHKHKHKQSGRTIETSVEHHHRSLQPCLSNGPMISQRSDRQNAAPVGTKTSTIVSAIPIMLDVLPLLNLPQPAEPKKSESARHGHHTHKHRGNAVSYMHDDNRQKYASKIVNRHMSAGGKSRGAIRICEPDDHYGQIQEYFMIKQDIARHSQHGDNRH